MSTRFLRHTLPELLCAAAVRERCTYLGQLAVSGQTPWFRIDRSKLPDCAALVATTCRTNYPDLRIPYHSRWRHFEVGTTNLWRCWVGDPADHDPAALTRTAIDLSFVSVLLDAGAGVQWRFKDPITGAVLSRSEGLAAASVDLFFRHLSRRDPGDGFCLDRNRLGSLSAEEFRRCFQDAAENPLVGTEGRLRLLAALGRVLSEQGLQRPGEIYDELTSGGRTSVLPAGDILELVLHKFSAIWPNGLVQEGVDLGDAGRHRLLSSDDETSRIVPFHKLSQWLSYSLIEPLQWSGIEVTDLDALTGLPEYRNGGLFIDCGVIVPLDDKLLQQNHRTDSEPVVEWRALTVYLLDELAVELRSQLQTPDLSLASILQGGTWSAGRRLAYRLRSDGSPPLRLDIDGTTF